MKIYISGKISGLPEAEVAFKFEQARQKLLQEGHSVVNPFEIGLPFEAQWLAEGINDRERWERHMDRDLDLLRDCDAIYMLDNWSTSRGAIIELKEAISHRMPVLGYMTGEQLSAALASDYKVR